MGEDGIARARRVLIDWDFAADGIWLIRGSEHGPSRPWSQVLTAELLDELKSWNRIGEVLGRTSHPDDALVEAFWPRARVFAKRAQAELGPTWEVLHVSPGGAWTWVEPPKAWPHDL